MRPRLEITWLDLDNRLGVPGAPENEERSASGAAVSAPAAGGLPANQARELTLPRKPKSVASREQRRFSAEQVELAGLSPGDAALVLLVRCDRVRGSPYAESVRELLRVFYDYRILLGASDLDPIRDFEALLIATPNPYAVTRTFLAARHALDGALIRSALERSAAVGGGQMRWRREASAWVGETPSPPRLRNDSRLVIVREGLVLLVEERLRRALGERMQGARGRGEAEVSDARATLSLADALARLDEQGGAGKRGPALLIQAINLQRLVSLPEAVPPPRNFQITATASDPAQVRGVASFSSPGEATLFQAQLQGALSAAQRSFLLIALGYDRLIRRLSVASRGRRLRLRLDLSASELRPLLAMLRDAIPQVPVPGLHGAPGRKIR